MARRTKALRGAGSGNVAEDYNALYVFFQDDWKVMLPLTINAGHRATSTAVFRRAANLQAINAIADDPSLNLFFRAPKPDTNDFSPRPVCLSIPLGEGSGPFAVGRESPTTLYRITSPSTACRRNSRPSRSRSNLRITCGTRMVRHLGSSKTDSGQGFLQGGGLLTTNVPPTTQADAARSLL